MNTQIIDNGDGTFSEVTTVPFDPVAVQAEIDNLKLQQSGAMQLASDNASNSFQPQIDALQAKLDTAMAVPAISSLLNPVKIIP